MVRSGASAKVHTFIPGPIECSHVYTVFLNPGFKWGIDPIYLCGFGGLYVSMSESMSPAVQRSTFNVHLLPFQVTGMVESHGDASDDSHSALGVTARPQMTNIALTL